MKRVLLGVGLLAAVLGTGCEPPRLIDQTRPDYIRKADLTSGTWYIRETVVDVPPTTSLSFVGWQGKMEKVRFEVQEDQLVAFRTYEEIPGTDPLVDVTASSIGKTVTVDGKPYRGSPVAAWKIKSHFDRQRTYNAATGEQSNVLVEDTQDQPWYDREFMRVDWDSQIVRNYESVRGTGDGEGKMGGLQPHVSVLDSEEGDDQFVMEYREVDGGKQELAYLDFTNRQFWEPNSINYPGYGAVPYCLFDPTEDCSGQVLRVRTSVLRVNEAEMLDYEPLRYDDKAMVKFGFFRTERMTYDRNRGIPESGRILWANRHNIWEKSRDAAGKAIPVDQRQPKPIVYHLSLQFPTDIIPAARELEAEWDRAFRRAVAIPRGATPDTVPQMFVLCENPVPAGAHPACGVEGTAARLGDLRYNFLAWVDQVQKSGPLGYGPSSADPETGEIISASAYQYGAGMDSWAGDAQTIVEVLTGMRTVDELVSGKLSRDFVMTDLSPTDARRPSSGPWSSDQGLTSDATPNAPFARVKGDLKATLDKFRADNGLPVLREDRRRVVAELIGQNPALESSLIELPEVRSMVLSLAPGSEWRQRLTSDPQLYRTMARQTILRMDEFKALFDKRADWASKNNIWLAEFSDDSFYGLAKSMKATYDDKVAALMAKGTSETEAKRLAGADIYLHLRQAAFASIAEHEVGHTLGLRHNFQGSFDALNYQDGYWDLRKDTIGVMAGGKRVLPIRPADLKVASEMNQTQIDGRMRELQYSSIMDYGSRMNAQVHGLGKYDEAAILFGYAGGKDLGWVEVFADTREDMENPHTMVETTNLVAPLRVRGAQTQIPFAHVTHYTPYNDFHSDRFHYTTLPFQFAEKGLPFEQALEQGIQRMQKRSYKPWSQMKGYYEAMEAEYKRMNVGDVAAIVPDSELSRMVVAAVAPGGLPVEVPYMFCTDSEVFANVTCNRWDQGADIYEMSANWLSQYEDYYAFSNFRRDRYFFSISNVFNRTYGRLLGNLPNIYHNWLFNIYWYHYYNSLNPVQLEEQVRVGDPVYQAYFTMAVFDGVNTLTGTLSNVAPGYYGKVPATGTQPVRWTRLAENLPDASRLSDAEEAALRQGTVGAGKPYADLVYLPRGKGVRNQYTLYDSSGYDFFTRVNEVGHFWDQYAALNALSNSTTNFLGVDSGSDALRYSLPYYGTFDKELSQLYSSVWMENHSVYAPKLVKVSEDLATVELPAQINASDYINGFEYPTPAPIALDGAGAPVAAEQVISKAQWGTRFYTQFFGMAFFTENYNQDFAAQNMVYVLGSGESVEPIPGYSLVTFDDITGGGYTYAALQKDGAATQPAAPTMIRRAQELSAAWQAEADPVSKSAYENELREVTRSLEIMRGLYQVFGRTL